jgi:MFS family permease
MFYQAQFGILEHESNRNTWLVGLVNSAPYICCATIGCWLTGPMNDRLGRKGTVWVTCAISAAACLWQAVTNTWWHMLIARFALGFGIGPKSATVPMYASECAPPAIRGGLGTQWQMWTAFGIMLGLVADVALYRVPDMSGIVGLNWRLMMGSAALPAFLVIFLINKCPESPRWYLTKLNSDNRPRVSEAYQSMCRLRYINIQAARDVYQMSQLIEADKILQQELSGRKHTGWSAIIHEPRTRRAMLASQVVMILQQFCGINVIAYYSSTIFTSSGFTEYNALLASLGFGCVNFLFAIPATLTIDTFGRRVSTPNPP